MLTDEISADVAPDFALAMPVETSQTSQNGITLRDDGLRVLRNGTVVGPDGKFLTGGNNAHEISKLRWQRAQEIAREGMAAAGDKVGHGKTSDDAWRAVCKHAATQAMSHPTPRESVVAARFVGEASGYLAKSSPEQPGSGPALSLQLNSDALRLLLDRLASR